MYDKFGHGKPDGEILEALLSSFADAPPDFVKVGTDGSQRWPWFHPDSGEPLFIKDGLNQRSSAANILKLRLSVRKNSLMTRVRADPVARYTPPRTIPLLCGTWGHTMTAVYAEFA